MKKEKRIMRGEIIGKYVKIIDAKNKTLIGIEGKIIDETKNTITLETKRGRKKLIKSQITLNFINENIIINGKKIALRPEERINIR